ncbi:uncharacterized protein LOC129654084 isoform X3 [Bubalus kerabau]|uniref:uncharacterized protein LOC129654084 isoform X3 n=1 Tax=Bubalus carabanensis TaxID=3119969 RepID=UPI00244EEDF3|nr:uncharacterized protein LOC129654084 isoform X3 [Bubalus carabanensis]
MSRKYFAAPKRNTCLTASFNLSPNRCQYTSGKTPRPTLLLKGCSGEFPSAPGRPVGKVVTSQPSFERCAAPCLSLLQQRNRPAQPGLPFRACASESPDKQVGC